MTRVTLDRREREALQGIADGLQAREIAAQMCYSVDTVQSALRRARVKLHARTRSHLVAIAVRQGLVR